MLNQITISKQREKLVLRHPLRIVPIAERVTVQRVRYFIGTQQSGQTERQPDRHFRFFCCLVTMVGVTLIVMLQKLNNEYHLFHSVQIVFFCNRLELDLATSMPGDLQYNSTILDYWSLLALTILQPKPGIFTLQAKPPNMSLWVRHCNTRYKFAHGNAFHISQARASLPYHCVLRA